MPEFGPVLGKGDAMWRALSVMRRRRRVLRRRRHRGVRRALHLRPAGRDACEPGVAFVKALLSPAVPGRGRPCPRAGARDRAHGPPAAAAFWPELAGVRQPLAGEMAAGATCSSGCRSPTGYAVEIAMLIDVYEEVGLDAIAQVDLDVRQNRHQPLGARPDGGRGPRRPRRPAGARGPAGRSTAARSSSSSRAPWSTAT